MAEQIFEVAGFPVLDSYRARALMERFARGETVGESSLDLNLTREDVQLSEDGVLFSSGLQLRWRLINEIGEEERRVCLIQNGEPIPIKTFSKTTGWVRTLCATLAGPPTTLVSGIPMHRIKDTDPMSDTASKLKALGRISGDVLDTATGLGYTAIGCASSARKVTTLELDPAAIEIASYNPWSGGLFENKKIEILIGDAFELVNGFREKSFEGILHDPPTLSLGGELYSEEFYRRLFRVLKRGGRLFHYIGDPNSGVGKRGYPGVMKRLKAVGFKAIQIEDDAFGVSASTG